MPEFERLGRNYSLQSECKYVSVNGGQGESGSGGYHKADQDAPESLARRRYYQEGVFLMTQT